MENTNYLGEQSGARAIVISIMTFIIIISMVLLLLLELEFGSVIWVKW